MQTTKPELPVLTIDALGDPELYGLLLIDKAQGWSSFDVVKRLDSRGNLVTVPSFVVAIGKTFKSGKLNIPVNAFFIPNSDGHRFGISVGFNTSSFRR